MLPITYSLLIVVIFFFIVYLEKFKQIMTTLTSLIPKRRDLSNRRLLSDGTDGTIAKADHHALPRPNSVDGPYPQDFLDAQFDKQKELDLSKYIGTYDNAGVIYADDFIKQQYEKAISIKEPASYTPYIQDYVIRVDRPPLQPFPRY